MNIKLKKSQNDSLWVQESLRGSAKARLNAPHRPVQSQTRCVTRKSSLPTTHFVIQPHKAPPRVGVRTRSQRRRDVKRVPNPNTLPLHRQLRVIPTLYKRINRCSRLALQHQTLRHHGRALQAGPPEQPRLEVRARRASKQLHGLSGAGRSAATKAPVSLRETKSAHLPANPLECEGLGAVAGLQHDRGTGVVGNVKVRDTKAKGLGSRWLGLELQLRREAGDSAVRENLRVSEKIVTLCVRVSESGESEGGSSCRLGGGQDKVRGVLKCQSRPLSRRAVRSKED
ncbi:hypothetical protein BC830DRAFT_1114815 [Chytriomyces sp. MP71]|nr:hypothetical protein BC830DRAFT_1114815 [Chytriomyces sp. MP71]